MTVLEVCFPKAQEEGRPIASARASGKEVARFVKFVNNHFGEQLSWKLTEGVPHIMAATDDRLKFERARKTLILCERRCGLRGKLQYLPFDQTSPEG